MNPFLTFWNRLLAAISFFTRLPAWRLAQVQEEDWRHVVEYWPLVGWLTGGVTAATFWLLSQSLPVALSLVLAYGLRLLLTGALHEDGLADCCDAFGGGRSREDYLRIMKDSRIGSYGVIGLIFYTLTLLFALQTFPAERLPLVILSADVTAKSLSSFLILLPYVRRAEEAKNRLVYTALPWLQHLVVVLLCLALTGLLLSTHILLPLVLSGFSVVLWMTYIRRRIGGYTGDCCGACMLLSEVVYILVLLTQQ